jgi:regulatory protein
VSRLNSKALEAALALLVKRETFRLELEDHLRSAGFGVEEVQAVVIHLQAKGVLRDDRTARSLAERRASRQWRSTTAVEAELESKGLQREVIAEAIQSLDDRETACQALRKKFPASRREDRARAGRFLFARGFAEDLVEAALNLHFGAEE